MLEVVNLIFYKVDLSILLIGFINAMAIEVRDVVGNLSILLIGFRNGLVLWLKADPAYITFNSSYWIRLTVVVGDPIMLASLSILLIGFRDKGYITEKKLLACTFNSSYWILQPAVQFTP